MAWERGGGRGGGGRGGRGGRGRRGEGGGERDVDGIQKLCSAEERVTRVINSTYPVCQKQVF